MATTTPLLGLTKPAVSDPADISVLNNNFDLIDAFFKQHGVGRSAYGIDSLDNATTFGLYMSNVGVPPLNGTVYWVALVMPHNTTQTLMQLAYRSTSNPIMLAMRRMTDGVWGEWEYLNPPMSAGVEYRTARRCDGKPVYVKHIVYTTADVGADGSVSDIRIPHGITGFGSLVSVHATMKAATGDYVLPYLSTAGGLTLVSSVGNANITVRTQGAWSGNRTWVFDLAYTKV